MLVYTGGLEVIEEEELLVGDRKKNPEYRGLLATDLDGTLLNSERRIGDRDMKTLEDLGDKGYLRVIATGRSLYSLRKVLDGRLPVDYVLFSSGAGILDFLENRIVRKVSLEPSKVGEAARVLDALNMDFMIHRPIPENHHFSYKTDGDVNPDFRRRCEYYKSSCRPLSGSPEDFGRSAQLIAIESIGAAESAKISESTGQPHLLYDQVYERLPDFTVIRTTSPMDGESMWIEIFPGSVSKGKSTAWLARQWALDSGDVLAVGNDYNDLDLLSWAGTASVVLNAPNELKERFTTVASHNNEGVSEAVEQWLGAKDRPRRSDK
jgi:hydroxymethylpyrimidine pyrophosphatase-like HAD family hydrolase